MKLYKILMDGRSSHGGDLKWDLPKNGKPGRWHHAKGELEVCSNGLHLTSKPFNWYKWGCEAYEAEAKGIKEWEEDKCVARSVRLIKKVNHPRWWREAEAYVKDLENIAWLKPDGKPLKKWKMFYGDNWGAARGAAWGAAWGAARDAARDAAWGAAWDAARDAAWGAARGAAWDAARDAAWGAARGAARDAARGAAWGAAWGAARDAARDAAWGAELEVGFETILKDVKVAKKHRLHAKAWMQVWRKGYALFCDVDGVLYVYAPKEFKPKGKK